MYHGDNMNLMTVEGTGLGLAAVGYSLYSTDFDSKILECHFIVAYASAKNSLQSFPVLLAPKAFHSSCFYTGIKS